MTATTLDQAISSLPRAHAAAVPYELRIGVTGHRELADPAAVLDAVRTLMRRISDTLGRSELVPIRWTVVSPLASGADQIVAEVLLEEFGASLEVILPFALDEYRKDFKGAELEQFERLYARATHKHPLEGPFGEERDPDDMIEPESRKLAYRRLGEQVVDTSEIVLAIWNGKPAAGIGGTAEIVHYAIEHQRLVLWIHPAEPAREAEVIRAVHRHGDAMKITSSALRTAADEISRGYSQQLAYHRDADVHETVIAREIDSMTNHLQTIAAQCGLAAAELQPVTALVPHYVRSDLLARAHQRRHIRATHAVMALAGSAVTIAVAQTIFFPKAEWIISFEIIGMLAAFACWQWSQTAQWHEKWLHDRYLAERLRLIMFSALVDVPDGVLLDQGLPFYPGPQNWLRGVVDELARRAISLRTAAPPAAIKNFLLRAWLRDQHDHHANNARRVHGRAHRRHVIGRVLFVLTLIAAILHLTPIGHGPAKHVITFFALILPVWAGGIHAVTTQLELDRVAERSRRMTRLLSDRIANMAVAETPGDVQRTVHEAARVMARETHEWWVLLSFQNVQLHV